MAEGQPLRYPEVPGKVPLQDDQFLHAEPPPPYQQQDPSFQQQQPIANAPPPPQTARVQRIIVTAPAFGEKPVHLQCPNCRADIRTTVNARLSMMSQYMFLQKSGP